MLTLKVVCLVLAASHSLQLMHDGGAGRFRPPKRRSFGITDKLALKIFRPWQLERELNVAIMVSGGLFKNYQLHKVNPIG